MTTTATKSKRTKKAVPAPILPRAWWRAVSHAWENADGTPRAEGAQHHAQRVNNAKDSLRLRTPGRGCDGGWHRCGDTDYPCSGCYGCRTSARPAWVISSFLWHVAVAGAHDEIRSGLAGLEFLATIGAAIEAALTPGIALSDFAGWAIRAYNEVRKGSWFRVDGRAGAAKNYYGLEGEVAWTGQDDYGTARAGLRIQGQSKLAYVSAGQLARVANPSWAAQAQAERAEAAAEKLARPDHVVAKGGRLHVVSGPRAGIAGTVFWIGSTKAGKIRYGVDTNPARPTTKKALKGYRAADEHTAWVDAVDCAAYALGSAEHIDAEAADPTVWRACANQ